MKKVILKQFGFELGHAIVEDDKAQEMIDIYLSNYKGMPERWEVLDPQNQVHNESQIIEEKTVVTQEAVSEIPAVVNEQGETVQEAIPGVPEVSHKEVKLKPEYTCEMIDVTAEVNQNKVNHESLAYLASTDWYIIREMDSGVQCPADIKQARNEARARIVK